MATDKEIVKYEAAASFYLDILYSEGIKGLKGFWPEKYSNGKTITLPDIGRVSKEGLLQYLYSEGEKNQDVIDIFLFMAEEHLTYVMDKIKSGIFWEGYNNDPVIKMLDIYKKQTSYREVIEEYENLENDFVDILDEAILGDEYLTRLYSYTIGQDYHAAFEKAQVMIEHVWSNDTLQQYFGCKGAGGTAALSNFIKFINNMSKIKSIKPFDYAKNNKKVYEENKDTIEEYFAQVIDTNFNRDILGELNTLRSDLGLEPQYVQDKFNTFKKKYKE
jgi:hypothetical protein